MTSKILIVLAVLLFILFLLTYGLRKLVDSIQYLLLKKRILKELKEKEPQKILDEIATKIKKRRERIDYLKDHAASSTSGGSIGGIAMPGFSEEYNDLKRLIVEKENVERILEDWKRITTQTR